MTGNMNVSLLWRKDLSERGHDFFRIFTDYVTGCCQIHESYGIMQWFKAMNNSARFSREKETEKRRQRERKEDTS